MGILERWTLEGRIQALETEARYLRQRIAELEAMLRWIPVKERLPERRTKVLTQDADLDSTAICYLDDAGWWKDQAGYRRNVIRWRPLPGGG